MSKTHLSDGFYQLHLTPTGALKLAVPFEVEGQPPGVAVVQVAFFSFRFYHRTLLLLQFSAFERVWAIQSFCAGFTPMQLSLFPSFNNCNARTFVDALS